MYYYLLLGRGVTKYKFMRRKNRQGVWGPLKFPQRVPGGGGPGGEAPMSSAILRILNGKETVYFRKLRQPFDFYDCIIHVCMILDCY